MKCLLLYYTGTNNTEYLTNLLKERLQNKGLKVDTYRINPLKIKKIDFSSYDLLGLGYPIYGFNTPYPFVKFFKKQTIKKGLKTFIYKNSGETYHANDASSIPLVKKLHHDGALLENEYHFMMPYNIHFRFDENLVKEILEKDDMLLDILVKEVLEDIPNIKKYKIIDRIVTFFVKLQYIGGPINSFFYKIEKDKCINCNKCIDNCPMKNIYLNKKGKISFHHNCIMCMKCSMECPKNAVKIGLFDSWRVNKPYDFKKIREIRNEKPVIDKNTKGFFKCYIETYENIQKRYEELFK